MANLSLKILSVNISLFNLAIALSMLVCACSKAKTNSEASLSESANSIGVVECDDYLSKYEQCVLSHVPAARRQQFEDHVSRTRLAWKSMAQKSGTKPGLKQACNVARTAAQKGMQRYNCSW